MTKKTRLSAASPLLLWVLLLSNAAEAVPPGLPAVSSERVRRARVSDKHLSKTPAQQRATEEATARVEDVLPDPPPTQSSHASSLVTLRDGTVLAAWFGGTKEGHPDVGIWVGRREAEGRGTRARWLAPILVAKTEEVAHWNPVLFHDGGDGQDSRGDGGRRFSRGRGRTTQAEERVFLQFKVGARISHWVTYAMHSDDGFRSWTEPRPLVPGDARGGRGCVRTKPLLLPRSGALLCGSSVEPRDENGNKLRWWAFVDRSTDGGATWHAAARIQVEDDHQEQKQKQVGVKPVGLIQPSLWCSDPEHGARHVHSLMRSTAGWVYRSDSDDGGRSWTTARRTRIPNNNSGIDVARLGDGSLMLAFNPVSRNWGPRMPLRLALSTDNGESWVAYLDLEHDKGSFAYPAIVPWRSAAGHPGFALTYTINRRNIRFLAMTMDQFHSLATPAAAYEPQFFV